jgi:hypothetical protein
MCTSLLPALDLPPCKPHEQAASAAWLVNRTVSCARAHHRCASLTCAHPQQACRYLAGTEGPGGPHKPADLQLQNPLRCAQRQREGSGWCTIPRGIVKANSCGCMKLPLSIEYVEYHTWCTPHTLCTCVMSRQVYTCIHMCVYTCNA